MKIAHKIMRHAVSATLMSCAVMGVTGFAVSAQAQINPAGQVATPAIPAPTVPAAAAAPAAAPVATPAPVADSVPAIVSPPTDPTVAAAATPAPEKEEKGAKSLNNAEDKITDSARNVAKRLGSTDNVTLDDLNSARQTVAKIEALIDIEKHLNELDKLRSEHESNRPSLASAIPASALGGGGSFQQQSMQGTAMPMGVAMPMPMPAAVVQTPMPTFSNVDISRIIGSGGHFTAVIKGGDGQAKTVEVGDHIDGATVTSITSTGVELERNNTKHVVHVKNVQTVFGNTP